MSPQRRAFLAGAVGISGAAVLGTAIAHAATTIYVSTNSGSNSNSGSSTSPVKDLAGAKQRLIEAGGTDATVRIADGYYYQGWRFHVGDIPQTNLTLTRWGSSGRPIFDGRYGSGDNTHFWLRVPSGKTVQVSGLAVRYYVRGGVHLDGADNCTFSNLFFRYIGNAAMSGASGWGLGAFYTTAAQYNTFDNIVIEDAINSTYAGNIHAFYLNQVSSRNTINNVRMYRISGDPIRLRTGGSYNEITNCHFEHAGNKGTDRASVSYWRFASDEPCGHSNSTSGLTTNGRDFNGNTNFPLLGNGASSGVSKCGWPYI